MKQYGKTTAIKSQIELLPTYFDTTSWQNSFHDMVWNVETAQGFGLDIWSNIVWIENGRYLEVQSEEYFGFSTKEQLDIQIYYPQSFQDPYGLTAWTDYAYQDSSTGITYYKSDTIGYSIETANALSESWDPFDQSPFYNGPSDTYTYKLADNAFRVLIMAKAMANISDVDVFSLNKILNTLTSSMGKCWVNDLGGMAIRYTFAFVLDGYQKAIIQSGILPRPAGVRCLVSEIPEYTFGFAESNTYNDVYGFDEGQFIQTGAITDVS